MLPITPTRPNAYTGSPLDRAAHRRDDAAWIATALEDPRTLWVPVWRGRSLLRDDRPAYDRSMRDWGGPWAFLGLLDDTPLFAVDVSPLEDPAVPEGTGFIDLRHVAGRLSDRDAAVLAHARGMMHWRVRHRFCGHCGAALTPRSAGTVMHCNACGAEHFPRTDPAVIMLVVAGDRALLAHSARFPVADMYSTLAGFVEPGESLEEAVAREVLEESGVTVGRVAYHSSQPWPFPASLMVGFHAEATSDAITIDEGELTDARWFTRAQIADPAAHGFSIPRADSIASRLIEDWVAL